MRALVTGGAGFIGSALARRLVADNWKVRVLDNLLSGSSGNVPEQAEFIEGDLRKLGDVQRSSREVDVVFHQAAFRSVPRSIDDPVQSLESNALGTLHVLMAAEENGVGRVINASSSSVYGPVDGPQEEARTPAPASPYAASKLAAETYCRVWTKLKGLPTISLRYFNVFGPGQRPDGQYSAVFPAFCDALVRGAPPEIHGDGEQSRDFTFIDDVVEANLKAAHAGEDAYGGAFNIAGGRPRSINEVLRAVSESLGKWVDPTHGPRRAGDVRNSQADLASASRTLGWAPASDWGRSVDATVAFFTSEKT